MNNRDSLRTQLIYAMTPCLGEELAENVFQHDIWPVLSAAMDAGELLVARNTQATVSIPEALKTFVAGTVLLSEQVKNKEATVLRSDLLKMVLHLGEQAKQALADIDRHSTG